MCPRPLVSPSSLCPAGTCRSIYSSSPDPDLAHRVRLCYLRHMRATSRLLTPDVASTCRSSEGIPSARERRTDVTRQTESQTTRQETGRKERGGERSEKRRRANVGWVGTAHWQVPHMPLSLKHKQSTRSHRQHTSICRRCATTNSNARRNTSAYASTSDWPKPPARDDMSS